MTDAEQRAESAAYARGYHEGYQDGKRETLLKIIEALNEPDERVFTDSQKS